jgi:L-ribulose-5-phosphate 3-epimerase
VSGRVCGGRNPAAHAARLARSQRAAMLIGYNTNGFAHHRLEDTLEILAELGYGAVGITLDHGVLNPFEPDLVRRVDVVRRQLERLKLRCAIETGARFLLDPRQKHQPTLLSPTTEECARRLDFLCQAIVIARDLAADCVSFWSGTPTASESYDVHFERLADGCLRLCDEAARHHVRLAFEPEPGMLIDTQEKFARLHTRIARPNFGVTIDVGHLHCQGETPIADHLRRWRDCLWNIHIEDMRRGVHDHLMFGQGEIDFTPILKTLRDIGYSNGAYVELSRHSHDSVNTARQALAFLQGHGRP